MGRQFLNELNGMYAFAIYDMNISKIILSRDKMGEKPLYYLLSKNDNDLFFASEYNSLKYITDLIPGEYSNLNYDSAAWYFGHKAMPSEKTIVKTYISFPQDLC